VTPNGAADERPRANGGPPLLVVEDLKTYFFTRRGTTRAVDGVSFTLHAGETLAIVGESGSGKSVTCLSVVRLVPEPAGRIVGGRVLFAGEDLLAKSPAEMRRVRGKQIAMVLQDPMTSLNPALQIGTQVGEVVRLHQGLRGPALRERVLEALSRLRIPGAASRLRSYQHELSGGMRQRVSSAIGMSCAPRLFIADEPTTALDVTIQAQYLELLKEVQRATGVAVILVTHDFGIVAANADRVAVMYAGKIVEMGDTLAIFDRPAHPYTQALLSCLPDVDLKRQRLVEIGGQPPDLAWLPAGCPFAPRCPKRQPVCDEAYPPAVTVDDGHVAHCWVASPAAAPVSK
jgi:oligopeptide/dipeptide ABC transporter ATP-binding protein